MKSRGKLLGAGIILLVVAGLVPIIRHYQLKAAVDSYRIALKAMGEPMELAQVLPPPPKPERNGTELFLKAAKLVEADKTFLRTNSLPAMKMVARGKAMICSSQRDVIDPGEYGFTNSWAAAEAAVVQNDEVLKLLRQTINRPELNFNIQYEHGFYDTNFFDGLPLAGLKHVATYLKGAAMVDLHQGNVESAVENVRAMLVLANAMQSSRLAITELVRMAIASIAQGATWEILQVTNLTDMQLATLQANWSQLDFLRGYRDALNMESLVGDIEVARWRASNQEMYKLVGLFSNVSRAWGVEDGNQSTAFERVKLSGQIFMWRYWWSYSDELRSLKGQAVLMETARYAATNGAFLPALRTQTARLDELGIGGFGTAFASAMLGSLDFHSMLSQSISMLGSGFKKAMAAECLQRMTITAIALKRFQLQHGQYPHELSEITPEFLATVPLDPVDGQPLRYSFHRDGSFKLYSVGLNGVDDGGSAELEPDAEATSFYWQNAKALDWVWPQPADEAEIQKYLAGQAK